MTLDKKMTLNLENDNVITVKCKHTDIREYFNGKDLPEDVQTALDEAQGYVFTNDEKAYLVIEIT